MKRSISDKCKTLHHVLQEMAFEQRRINVDDRVENTNRLVYELTQRMQDTINMVINNPDEVEQIYIQFVNGWQ